MEKMEPPPTARSERSEEWRNKVATMKANKGEYYKVGDYSPGVATHIRRGKYKAFLDGQHMSDDEAEAYMKRHWEITTRKTTDGRNDVFVCWLGE